MKNNTFTDTNTKEPRPSKDPKSAKEPKSVKVKPEAKPRGHHIGAWKQLMKIYGGNSNRVIIDLFHKQ
jgi:hypothetical protein